MTRMQPLHLLTAAVPLAAAAQADAAAAPHWTDVVTAVSAVIIALTIVGGAIVALPLVRSLARLMRSMDRSVERLTPRARPLFDHAERVAEDARAISHSIRCDVERLEATVDGIDERVRAAADAAEVRVRRLGAALDVLQEEAEELLLDAAATARGVQKTAEELRRPRARQDAARRRASDD